MATSGSKDFSVSRSTIIQDVCEDLGLKDQGQTIENHINTKAIFKFQSMIKAGLTNGSFLHAISEGTLFLVKDQESYTLGTGGDEATASYKKTEMSTAAVATDTVLKIDSSAGMTAADYIGIELDGGDLQWSTIASVDSTTQVTIDDVLTDAAAVDNHVYTYTTIIEKPVRILPGTVRIENSDGKENPINLVDRKDYMRISNKASAGVTNKVYYQPLRTTGLIYTWPVASDVKRVIHFSFERTIEDMDANANEPDFPIQACEYLIAGLRYRMGRIAGFTDAEIGTARDEALDAEARYLNFDTEDGSVYFQPDLR